MADAIIEGTFEHDALSDDALVAIVKEFCQHPVVRKIINHIVTEEDFKSAFKCVPEKMALSFPGRGVHYYKAYVEVSEDRLTDIQSSIHA
jgi:hypothetical protein